MIEVRPLTGDELAEHLPALAVLRIAVFSDYPYLYDGDAEYEHRYLAEYAAAPNAVLVAAFEERGFDTGKLFYFGESVLLPRYRGHGIGHAFFDHREDAARKAGAEAAIFASVIRADNHPDRPHDYRPLSDFWTKRGYAPVEGLISQLAWKEHGEESESHKPMQYWMRAL